MKPRTFMVIAGEASGDLLAAELVRALRAEYARAPLRETTDSQPLRGDLEPRFFGAGGPQMAAAGVELAFDLTSHAVIGLSAVIRNLLKFRRLFGELFRLACKRQPDVIICVDFAGFNRRFGQAVKAHARARGGWFQDWDPRLIQMVSPQVWASRPSRADKMARDFDLLLSIFPFEKEWYSRRVPGFPVEFVGHFMVDRFAAARAAGEIPAAASPSVGPRLLLLPGSRPAEVRRHLPVMLGALEKLRADFPTLEARMVLPSQRLLEQAKTAGLPAGLETRVGGIAAELARADLALAKTGTTTMECAFFGVPAVTLYKESFVTYQVAKRIVTVKYLSMPNLLADAPVYPEFIQEAATPANLAAAAADLLRDGARRAKVKDTLAGIIRSLGAGGAATRAAAAIRAVIEP